MIDYIRNIRGFIVARLAEALGYKQEGRWFDSRESPRVDSASNGNVYQVSFLGVKAAGA